MRKEYKANQAGQQNNQKSRGNDNRSYAEATSDLFKQQVNDDNQVKLDKTTVAATDEATPSSDGSTASAFAQSTIPPGRPNVDSMVAAPMSKAMKLKVVRFHFATLRRVHIALCLWSRVHVYRVWTCMKVYIRFGMRMT